MDYLKYVIAFIVVVGLIYGALIALDVFTPEAFSLLAAGLLAAVFERFKWIKEAYDKLPSSQKQIVQWVMVFVVVFGAFGLSCAGQLPAFECTGDGALRAVVVLFVAIGVNEGVYRKVRIA